MKFFAYEGKTLSVGTLDHVDYKYIINNHVLFLQIRSQMLMNVEISNQKIASQLSLILHYKEAWL